MKFLIWSPADKGERGKSKTWRTFYCLSIKILKIMKNIIVSYNYSLLWMWKAAIGKLIFKSWPWIELFWFCSYMKINSNKINSSHSFMKKENLASFFLLWIWYKKGTSLQMPFIIIKNYGSWKFKNKAYDNFRTLSKKNEFYQWVEKNSLTLKTSTRMLVFI